MFEVYLKGFGKLFDTLGKYTYREMRSALGLLQKNLGALKVVTNNIYFSNVIFPLMFIKVLLILIQKNKDC